MTAAEALDQLIDEAHRAGFVEGYDAAIAALQSAANDAFFGACTRAGEGVGSVDVEACRRSVLGLPDLPEEAAGEAEEEDDGIPF